MLRLGGNFVEAPFLPAHLNPAFGVFERADAVLAILFPQLAQEEARIAARMAEVDQLKTRAPGVLRDEQLLDRNKLVTSLRFVCRVALCCSVGRPRTWRRWEVEQQNLSLWQRVNEPRNRALRLLFAGNQPAIDAMNHLAVAVRESELAEITARRATPSGIASDAIVSAVREMQQQNQQMLQQILSAVGSGGATAATAPTVTAAAAPVAAPAPASAAAAPPAPPLAAPRDKRKRETQEDVIYFSHWTSLGDAVDYARRELAPREREAERTKDASWRIRQKADGGEDKSRDKQWRCYKSLAIAVALAMESGSTEEAALATLQGRFDALGSKAHTPLLSTLRTVESALPTARKQALAKAVLCF